MFALNASSNHRHVHTYVLYTILMFVQIISYRSHYMFNIRLSYWKVEGDHVSAFVGVKLEA